MLDFRIGWNTPNTMYEMAKCCRRATGNRYVGDGGVLETSAGNLPKTGDSAWVQNTTPSAMMWQGNGHTVISIAGIFSNTEAANFIRLQLNPLDTAVRNVENENVLCRTWCNALLNAWQANIDAHNIILIAGHSAGSGTAHMLARVLRQRKADRAIYVYTFGSPKWCNQMAANNYLAYPSVRLMNEGDIIPYLLPSVTQSPAFNAMQPFATYWIINRLVHLPYGIQCRMGSGLYPSNDPWGIGTPFELSLMQATDALAGIGQQAHWSETYERVLYDVLWRGGVFDEVNRMPQVNGPLRLHFPPLREMQDDWRQLNRATLIPQTFVPDVQVKGRIRVFTQFKVWYVRVGDSIVYNATSKRDAKGVAHALRAFQRQLKQQPQRFQAPSNLPSQLLGQADFSV